MDGHFLPRALLFAALLLLSTLVLARDPAFVRNEGQWPSGTLFRSRAEAGGIEVRSDGLTVVALDRARGRAHALRLSPAAGGSLAAAAGEGVRRELRHFFIGSDPARWRSDVASFDAVAAREVWPGIALRLRHAGAELEYDWILAPGADLGRVALTVSGLDTATQGGLRIDPEGALEIPTPLGTLRQRPPVSWQIGEDGGRRPVEVAFRILAPDRFGFAASPLDGALPLVIDPVLEWSTFLGGGEVDELKAVRRDAAGNWVTAGVVSSLDFPTVPGGYDLDFNGVFDVAVARFSPSGADLISATYLGGGATDTGVALAIDGSDGSLLAGGYAWSPDFPTTPGAYDTVHGDLSGILGDGFVARLSGDGSQLLFSTFIGGPGADLVSDVEWSAAGGILVAGVASAGFPVPPTAMQDTVIGPTDGFVLRLAPGGAAALAGTLIGGSLDDEVRTATFSPSGEIWIAGPTRSADLPTTPGALMPGPADPVAPGAGDLFVARLDPGLGQLLAATYFGGDGEDTAFDSLPADGGGVVLCGRTQSATLPLPAGAFASGGNGSMDAFVVELPQELDSAVRGARLGGSEHDQAFALARTADGVVTVAGTTQSEDFPVTPATAIASTFAGGSAFGGDLFIARLDAAMVSLIDSTYLGGVGADHAFAIASDGEHAVVVAGLTFGPGFPVTAGAHSTSYGGGLTDSVLVRISYPVPEFTRAEANGDGTVGIADGITVLSYLFTGGALSCRSAADVDGSGAIDLADPIGLFAYLFLSAPPPPPPFPGCGAPSGALTCHRSACP